MCSGRGRWILQAVTASSEARRGGWYEEYQKRGENYEEEVAIVYQVKINWIHLS